MNKLNKRLTILAVIICTAVTACNSDIVGGGNSGGAKSDVPAVTNRNSAAKADNKATEEKTEPQTKQENTIEVYDGRKFESEPKAGTDAEKQLAEKEFKLHENDILQKVGFKCEEGDEGVSITETAEGSFTKPNSSQKVLLYERCRAGRAFGVGGILIVENGKAVAHYAYGENGLFAGISSLPDVNKNGLSELVFLSVGTGQGYSNSAIDVFEFKAGDLDFLGRTETYSSNSGAVTDRTKAKTEASKISVEPAANPAFFRETYEQKGSSQKWSQVKKAEKFSLNKGEPIKYHKIS